jgi:hypothetical protein
MALAAFRHKTVRRLYSWLLIVALLFPAVLPALHHPGAFGMAMSPICHTDVGGHSVPSDHGKGQAPCPVCQTMAALASGFVPPTIPVITPPSLAPMPSATLVMAVRAFDQTVAAYPRGPPAFA